MHLREFHNGLRILLNLDQDQLVDVGALAADDWEGWLSFRENPFDWMIRAGDAQAECLWALMKTRMSKE